MTTQFFTIHKTDSQILADIAAIEVHEKTSRIVIGEAAGLVLQHCWNHGNAVLATKLVQAVTPANRAAIVLLMKECTSFIYDKKTHSFGKLSPDAKKEKEKKLEMTNTFFEKYQGDIFAWFEKTKEAKIVEFKFNENNLVKALAGLFAEKGGEFTDEALAIIEAGKAKAIKMVKSQNVITARTNELVEMGIDRNLAEKQAKADLENGKITIEGDAVVAA